MWEYIIMITSYIMHQRLILLLLTVTAINILIHYEILHLTPSNKIVKFYTLDKISASNVCKLLYSLEKDHRGLFVPVLPVDRLAKLFLWNKRGIKSV